MAEQQPVLCEGLRIGGYELLKQLGRGGMGEVWLAHDPQVDRRAALKFIYARLLDDPGFRVRFLNEARTLGKLRHDRIVTLFAVIEEDPHLALALEFIEGPQKADCGTSLADKIDAEGALSVEFVRASARDILPALGFAHKRLVIHRDIKSQNVLLDSESRSFLTDFGIAVADFAERATRVGTVVGTPDYMSPEQIAAPWEITLEDGKKGHRTDIYSYGIVLYEMLCGRVPFSADTESAVQRAHCKDAPAALRELNPKVPASLEEVVLRCLAKSPDDRPQSCAELLRDIESATSGAGAVRAKTVVLPSGGSQAPAIPPPPVAPAASRRKRAPRWAWPAAGLVLIVAGIGYVAWPSKDTDSGAKDFKTASADWDGRKYCEGKDPIESALKKSPGNAQYVELERRLAQGCTAKGDYQTALALFDKKDCAGQKSIQQAVSLAANDPDFLALQQKFGQICHQAPSDPRVSQAAALDAKGEFCEAQTVWEGVPGAQFRAKERASAQRCQIARSAAAAFEGQQFCKAEPLYAQLAGLAPANAQYASRRQTSADSCKTPPGQSGGAGAPVSFQAGRDEWSAGEYCKALTDFNRAVSLAPGNQEYATWQAKARTGCNAQR